MQTSPVSIWIEAEVWPPESWDMRDVNSDIIVTFPDHSRWVASFFTYQNITTLTSHYQHTGELLHGAYFWASDMLLIQQLDRVSVARVIAQLLQENMFATVFRRLPDDSELRHADTILDAPVPPIILDNDGDLLFFDSIAAAEQYIEPIDIQNSEYVGYDARGHRLDIRVRDHKPCVQTVHNHVDANALTAILSTYLERVNPNERRAAHRSLEQLIQACLPYARTE